MRFSKKPFLIFTAAAFCLLAFSGCDRRTPEERLATAIQFYQQGDAPSAEMEAQKVVEKAPNDEAGIQASLLLAQIYGTQQRWDEAQTQLETILDKVGQDTPVGQNALKMYLAVLESQKKYDEALGTIDKYQKKYASNEGTSLSLTIAKADVKTMAGETTGAREILSDVISRTTHPAELALYRELFVKTYLEDANTTAAIEFLQKELADEHDPNERFGILTGLAGLEHAAENYPATRQVLDEITSLTMENVKKYPTRIEKGGQALMLGQLYVGTGNLPGARKVFQALHDADIENPAAQQSIITQLVQTLVRDGDTSGAEEVLKSAAQKTPQGNYAAALKQLQSISGTDAVKDLKDTSTLAVKFREDPNVLWPAQLPEVLKEAPAQTTATMTSNANTSSPQ